MELVELKEKIHNKIEASDKRVLEAIYILLENISTQGFEISDEDAEEIDKDVEDYISGKTNGYTFEEVKLKARKGA